VEAALCFVPTGAGRARTEVHRLALADALQLTDVADARDNNAGFGVGTRPVVRLIHSNLPATWKRVSVPSRLILVGFSEMVQISADFLVVSILSRSWILGLCPVLCRPAFLCVPAGETRRAASGIRVRKGRTGLGEACAPSWRIAALLSSMETLLGHSRGVASLIRVRTYQAPSVLKKGAGACALPRRNCAALLSSMEPCLATCWSLDRGRVLRKS
jgi:hypothetical protein